MHLLPCLALFDLFLFTCKFCLPWTRFFLKVLTLCGCRGDCCPQAVVLLAPSPWSGLGWVLVGCRSSPCIFMHAAFFSQASWKFWGHTRSFLPLAGPFGVSGTHTLHSANNPCISMHEAEDHLEVCMGTHTPRPLPSGPYFVCVPRGLLSSSQPKALSGGSCPLGSSPLFGLLPFVSFVRRFSFANCEGALQVGGSRVSSGRLMAHA